MRRGPWHQCGDKSQKLVIEQLYHGVGVGVVLSMRDISHTKAIEYASVYHDHNTHVLIDPQFYIPDFINRQLTSYPISQYRKCVSQLNQITDQDLSGLASDLEATVKFLSADGVIAPAVVYEAGRPEIARLNARLFSAAKRVGDAIGIPTYATVILGNSATQTNHTIDTILSQVTALNCDGFYYGFEFAEERVPASHDSVLRCCIAGLTLACTGKPVLHAFAGPMAILSFGFGATAVGVGHSQNLWQFTRERWGSSSGQGGGGKAPSRYFSRGLWGTIVYPDEISMLTPELQNKILTETPFSPPILFSSNWPEWPRPKATKHLIYVICSTASHISKLDGPQASAKEAISLLDTAVELHTQIIKLKLYLADNTNAYQRNWKTALANLLKDYSSDFEYLALLMK